MKTIIKHPPEYEVRTVQYEDMTLQELANIAKDDNAEAILDGDAKEATVIRRLK